MIYLCSEIDEIVILRTLKNAEIDILRTLKMQKSIFYAH